MRSAQTRNGDPDFIIRMAFQGCKLVADLDGFYKTGAIIQGGTASLCFIRSGKFAYEVRRLVDKTAGKPIEHILKAEVIVE